MRANPLERAYKEEIVYWIPAFAGMTKISQHITRNATPSVGRNSEAYCAGELDQVRAPERCYGGLRFPVVIYPRFGWRLGTLKRRMSSMRNAVRAPPQTQPWSM